MLARLSKAIVYTKLDIVAAFNRIHMAEGNEYKTAFRTCYGLFEYNVMPFSLYNMLSTFQNYINNALSKYLDIFCTAYLNNILIYSDSTKEYCIHVRRVLDALHAASLQANIDKCKFEVTSIKYLGLIITTDGIRMDPEKVEAIKDWSLLRNLKDAQGLLGFANFYQRFIRDFSRITALIVALTKKDTPFNYLLSCQAALDMLKDAFTQLPILAHLAP